MVQWSRYSPYPHPRMKRIVALCTMPFASTPGGGKNDDGAGRSRVTADTEAGMRSLIESLKRPALTWGDVSNIKNVLDRRTPKSPDYMGSVGIGKAERLGNSNTDAGLYDFVSYDPEGRQRADHYGNGGEGWDTENWDRDYAEPLRKWAQARLDDAMGRGAYRVEIGEKGDIYVEMGVGVAKR